jgi:hypothetical protein
MGDHFIRLPCRCQLHYLMFPFRQRRCITCLNKTGGRHVPQDLQKEIRLPTSGPEESLSHTINTIKELRDGPFSAEYAPCSESKGVENRMRTRPIQKDHNEDIRMCGDDLVDQIERVLRSLADIAADDQKIDTICCQGVQQIGSLNSRGLQLSVLC